MLVYSTVNKAMMMEGLLGIDVSSPTLGDDGQMYYCFLISDKGSKYKLMNHIKL